MIVTERRGSAFLVGFDRGDKRNALDDALVRELHRALDEAAAEPSVLVLHSLVPGVFVAGADIAELVGRRAGDALRSATAASIERVAAHPWPSIATVDGWALGGGCELAVACDFRIASAASVFGQPEADLGIVAAAGATWRLPQLVGLPVARRMLLAGERLDAEQALAAGLVDEVHAPGAVLEAALALAERIGSRSWRALELTKLALREHHAASPLLDRVAQALAFESDDKRTRMQAYLDRPGR